MRGACVASGVSITRTISNSIEQNAKDVVGLLKYLGIYKADFFGESYGGATAILTAVHYPELVGRVATYGATFGPPQVAHNLVRGWLNCNRSP